MATISAAQLDVDLVIVGYGAAGVAAAITAHDLGASVVVLEKNPEAAHTPNTRMSGGMVMTVSDGELGAQYLNACAGGMVPAEISAAWAHRAAGLLDWFTTRIGITDLAVATGNVEHTELPGAGSVRTVQPGGVNERLSAAAGGGPALWEHLDAAVRSRGIDVRWSSPARRLLRSADGRITGVEAEVDGVAQIISARNGVVLACGGYEFDEDMKRDFLRAYPVHFYGNPGNDGDGVRMAQAAGAGLWHMNQMIGRGVGHFTMDDGTPLNLLIAINPPGYVITDGAGRRFANEHAQAMLRHDFYYSLLEYDPATKQHPRIPCYWFFDERRRREGPITLTHIGAVAVGMYDWSPDNQAEIDRGWIICGQTIREVAEAAGISDPDEAARSVAAYNDMCAEGSADPFGRPADTMVPLLEPPFYCVPLWPGGSNTTGGPKRDQHGRILDAFDVPIPGLYGAGELGQPSGLLYPADGSNLSEAFCFGQIAVEHALSISRSVPPDGTPRTPQHLRH